MNWYAFAKYALEQVLQFWLWPDFDSQRPIIYLTLNVAKHEVAEMVPELK